MKTFEIVLHVQATADENMHQISERVHDQLGESARVVAITDLEHGRSVLNDDHEADE